MISKQKEASADPFLNMSALQLLKNASNSKPVANFDKLAAGDYFISNFAVVETKFGSRLRIDLGDKAVLLPERFTVGLTPEKVCELNEGNYILVYKGKDRAQNNKLIVDFEAVEEYIGPAFE